MLWFAAMPPLTSALASPEDARERVHGHGFWYHTIDVAPGLTTPGWFDLRHAFDLVPFPDVEGKRCLDVGTFDGFYAFEMERRGAAEVVAIDVEDHEDWDWPADARAGGPEAIRDPAMAGPPKGAGFRILADVLDSTVDWRVCNIYDIDPEFLGTFDVVVVGSLLIHLQNPVKALEAVRSVCDGVLFSCDQIEPWLTVFSPRRPVAQLRGTGRTCQWWLYNAAGHERILYSAGFRTIERSGYLALRFGSQHPQPKWTPRSAPAMLTKRLLTKDEHQGVLHRALLAEPRL